MLPLDRNHPQSFTTFHQGRSNVLFNEVQITLPFDPSSSKPSSTSARKYIAIWDTGATNSVITKKVIDECQLKPTGMVQISGVHGSQNVETYLVSVILPNAVTIPSLRVSRGTLVGKADVLIGMDIIGNGDFLVTTRGGKTIFSFRLPSMGCNDFVALDQFSAKANIVPTSPAVSKSAPCPCGSGLKYKRCHGR
jgi:hypothetical protein